MRNITPKDGFRSYLYYGSFEVNCTIRTISVGCHYKDLTLFVRCL